MTRLPAAALAALALTLGTTPASASNEPATTVGFSSDLAGYINAIYRPAVTTADTESVLQAECKFDATAYGRVTGEEAQETELVALVGKVVTNDADDTAPIVLDQLPAATGVVCEVWDGEKDVLVASVEGARPGTAAYAGGVREVTNVKKPRICVRAYILYGSGRQFQGAKSCKSS